MMGMVGGAANGCKGWAAGALGCMLGGWYGLMMGMVGGAAGGWA